MDPVPSYGDVLALVTVTRTAASPLRLPASLRTATVRPVRVVHVDVAGAPTIDGAEVVRLAEDVGRPAAVDRAVAGLDPSVGWVAIADPQVEWGPGALDVLLEAASRRPRAGVLAPRLRTPSGVDVPSGGELPTLRTTLRGRIPAAPLPDGPVGWVDGTCLLVRRTAWDSVDGYDPRYPGSGSRPDPADVDLCDRLDRAGWLVAGVPAAVVTDHARGVLDPHGPHDLHGPVLETRDRSLRRYVHDRHGAPARVLMALARRR